MSKIGFSPITIPSGVQITQDKHQITVKGPKGELSQSLDRTIELNIEDNTINISRVNNTKPAKAMHGLTRSILANLIVGVTDQWTKRLELVGTGYRAKMEGKNLSMSLGYSHPVIIEPAEGITFATEGQNIVIVTGSDKQLVGQTAANIRAKRPPEPYKGKGVRYENEVVRRKAGKAAKA